MFVNRISETIQLKAADIMASRRGPPVGLDGSCSCALVLILQV